jgi:hypothetical protein
MVCAGGAYIFFLLWDTFFSESLISTAAKKGKFFGWCVVLLVMVAIWLVIWGMLKEWHYKTSISVLIAFIFALCIGLLGAMNLGFNWPFETFGVNVLIIMAFLPISCLLVLFLIGVGRVIMKVLLRR